jgi:hypothetical protein
MEPRKQLGVWRFGATSDDNDVIGDGSALMKGIKDHAIAAGNPVKFVKFRFDQPTRIGLKKLLWWNWKVIFRLI